VAVTSDYEGRHLVALGSTRPGPPSADLPEGIPPSTPTYPTGHPAGSGGGSGAPASGVCITVGHAPRKTGTGRATGTTMIVTGSPTSRLRVAPHAASPSDNTSAPITPATALTLRTIATPLPRRTSRDPRGALR